MRTDLTVIYYTSNRENPIFEDKIRQTLLKTIEDLPLISVSQKPIDFGHNICVGEIGATPKNMLLQVKTGAEIAKTTFVGMAESDCLYHSSYFEFIPQRENTFYYPDEVYLIWENHQTFHLKRRAEITSIVNRRHLIQTIDKILIDSEYHISKIMPRLTKQSWFHCEIPIISIKTKKGMHWRSPYLRNKNKNSLPFWGTGKEVLEKYLCPE